jgi:hypothetical protein
MGLFSPDPYFKALYPDWFSETNFYLLLFYLFLFFLMMLAFYLYLRFFERRTKISIDDNEEDIGNVIDYGMHDRGLSYRLIIKKLSDTEWVAYKLFRSNRKLSLRRGNLKKIVDYMNRNFGYNDEVRVFD